MVMPNFYPASALAPQTASYIASDSPLRSYYMGRQERLEDERRNYLREAGGMISGGNIPGAMGALFRGGDVRTGIDVSNWDTGRRTQAITMLREGAARADTPERWAALIGAVERTFGADIVNNFRDFNRRPAALTALEETQARLHRAQEADLASRTAERLEEQERNRWIWGGLGFRGAGNTTGGGAGNTGLTTGPTGLFGPAVGAGREFVLGLAGNTGGGGTGGTDTGGTDWLRASPNPYDRILGGGDGSPPPGLTPPSGPGQATPGQLPPIGVTPGTIGDGSRERPFRTQDAARRSGRDAYYYGTDGQVYMHFSNIREETDATLPPPIPLPPRGRTSGPPGGLLLPLDPARLGELALAMRQPPPPAGGPGPSTGFGAALPFLRSVARGQTTPPPTPPPGITLEETPPTTAGGTTGIDFSRSLGTTGAPPPLTPPSGITLETPNAGGATTNILSGTSGTSGLTTTTPAGRRTLADIVNGMSDETRNAAMLLLVKRDFGALAKMIEGITPGTEAADREFAREFASWMTGGQADVQRQIASLLGTERALAGGGNITGPVVGSLPDAINRFINPEAIANRDRVREVVGRSLRQVLGGQFSEREAEALMARAYDQSQPPEENLRRVRLLLTQIVSAADARQGASEYFRQHGTLRGWQGRMPNLSDFTSLFDTPTTTTLTPGTRLRFDSRSGEITEIQ